MAPILAPILLRRKLQAKHEVMKVGPHQLPLAPTPVPTVLRRKLQAKHQVMKSGSNRLPLAPTPAPTLKMMPLPRGMQTFSFLLHVGSHWLQPWLPFVFEEASSEMLSLGYRPDSYYNIK